MKNLIISAEQKENYDKPLNVEIELLGEFTKTKEISNTRRLRKSLTPTVENKIENSVQATRNIKTPTARSKSKTKIESSFHKSNKKHTNSKPIHITTSKYFGNIFGEATALEYFKEENRQG